MNSRYALFTLALLLGSISISTMASPLRVTVSGAVANPGSFSFEPGARLNDAAAKAKVSSQAWFLGAALLRQSAMESQTRLKAGLLFELGVNEVHAQASNNPALAAWLDQMRSMVANMPVTGRVVAEMNPLQQLLISNNSPLETGDHLRYPLRPRHVRVNGAVESECMLEHDPNMQLTDYLKQCPRAVMADRSYAYVIQPNGTSDQYGIAHWNQERVNVAVGAIIYVPVREHLLAPTTSEFNQDMARMLATQYRLGGQFGE